MARIQVVVDVAERELFRAQAEREGCSLSEWLRSAGRDRLERARPASLATREQLDAFFADLDVRLATEGPAEEWESVKERIATSRTEGLPPV